MKKKIYVSILIASIVVLLLSTSVAAADTLTITDDINDVIKYDGAGEIVQRNVNFSDADIKEISFTQDGKTVEVQLKLVEGGKLRPTEDNKYSLILYTTSPSIAYFITYLGYEVEIEGQNFEFVIMDFEGNFYDFKDKDVQDDYFSVSFDLANKNEKCMSINALVEILATDYSYIDSVPDNLAFLDTDDIFFTVQPIAGGPYEGKTGDSITFQGSLEEGDPSEYEWVWLIQETGCLLYTSPSPRDRTRSRMPSSA